MIAKVRVVPEDVSLDDARELLAFIEAAPSPFHAVAEAAAQLEAVGFSRVDESDAWPIAPGRHFVVRGGSLVAWSGDVGAAAAGAGFRVVGAHTDSPNLRVKPRPDTVSGPWHQLGIEVYGGVLLNSWLDRDLGLSGRVSLAVDGRVETRLVRDDRPLLRIPQLAIHLDRELNQAGLKLNPQQHLTPIWALAAGDTSGPTGNFERYLADQLGVAAADILSWDVMTHDVQPGTLAGLHDEFVSSARLDNLLSCWAALRALAASTVARPTRAGDRTGDLPVAVVALFDHEEIGSQSASGASSDLLATVLERIVLAGGGDRAGFLRAVAASMCVSADGAHATHPNYPERHESGHRVHLNAGPVLKHNANARYATDAGTGARFELACRTAGVPLQHFVSRNDMACGSTIGPITASRLGIPTVDVGVAQLAMHSARELCGSVDPGFFRQALEAFLSAP
jgi:aspartyl aminopeptidase